MKVSRAMVVSGLAAGGLVLALANPASAGDWCDHDHHHHHHDCHHSCDHHGHGGSYHYEHDDNDILDLDLLNGIL